MKIAIHHRNESFSERWIQYCKQNKINFKIVNCYDTDIIDQVKGCSALLWHHHHGNYRDAIAATSILFALEQAGINVFPNFKTTWYFDDKVAQKYLLEAIEAPVVPSHVFYDKDKALKWLKETNFPKVFKLKGGAGSTNVKLVRSKKTAKNLIEKSFGRGFSQYNKLEYFKDRVRKVKKGRSGYFEILKGIARMVIPTEFAKMHGREKGYAYFQDFIPNNGFDIRVIVIGDKAFAAKRMVRKNDFRASGSGNAIYNKADIDIRCVKIAFAVNSKIGSQSIGYDFVFDQENNPLIVEIGYGFNVEFYDPCPGYWDSNFKWHEGTFNPQVWMLEHVIHKL